MVNTIILRDNETKEWRHFQQPKFIFTTKELGEVLPILQKVEELVKQQQYYAAGFISYEASAAFDAALKTHPGDDFPLIWFGLYEKSTVFNFDKRPNNVAFNFDWTPSISKKNYFEALEKIRHCIKIGDTYQVNFTMRQFAEYSRPAPKEELDTNSISPSNALNSSGTKEKTAFSLFQNIAQSAPYGAFMDIDDFSICSASPELFFKIKNGQITSSPMKGTAPRGRNNEEDNVLKNQLYHSQKDRSENVMIVDMIRNDLSKIAEIGTVKTPRLFDIEKYSTVWQMTSTVEGKTKANFTETMISLFPCASITGAPKTSTMQIISALENTPRRIYTGTIGFIQPNGDMQFNVAIRTALFDKKNKQVEYGTGGGITIKSEPQKEYEESLLKTKIIQQTTRNQPFKLLETMLWTPKNGWFLLDKHLARLEDAAVYFDYSLDIAKIEKALFRRMNQCKTSPQKVRLLVAKNGQFVIENYPIDVEEEDLSRQKSDFFERTRFQRSKPVQIATQPIDSSNPFLFHKTTNRKVYETHLRQFPEAKDVVLWNERGEVTESCFGNVVVFDGQNYWTPPLSCGLLNGVFRQELLERRIVQERVILKTDLGKMKAVFLINSVRKWERVRLMMEAEV